MYQILQPGCLCGFHPRSPLGKCTPLASPLLTDIADVRQTETAPATLELLTCWKFITQPIPSHCCLHSWSPQKTAAQVETVVSAHLKFFLITTNTISHCENTLTGQRLASPAAAESLVVAERGFNHNSRHTALMHKLMLVQ